MALPNFEDHAKQKLVGRQIKPSPQAWKKLENRLNAETSKSRNYSWLWAVAAVFLLAFLAGNFIFQTSEKQPEIVEEPVKEKASEGSRAGETVRLVADEERKTSGTDVSKEDTPKPAKKNLKEGGGMAESAKPQPEHIVLENIVISPPIPNPTKLEVALEKTISSVFVEKKKENVNQAEVDRLLEEAAKKISSENYQNPAVKISASGLLAEVETEIEQSFRRKVFEMLKEGYREARVAFENRNN